MNVRKVIVVKDRIINIVGGCRAMGWRISARAVLVGALLLGAVTSLAPAASPRSMRRQA